MFKYNFLTFSLVVLIVLSIVVGGLYFNGEVSRADETTLEEQQVVNDMNNTPETSSTDSIKNFLSFDQAFKFAFNKLKTSSGYTAKGTGSFCLGYDWYTLSENIKVKKVIDNDSKKVMSELGMTSPSGIGRNIGVRLTQLNGKTEVIRVANANGSNNGNFDFANANKKSLTNSEYLNKWGLLPQNICFSFEGKDVKLKNKSWSVNGTGYTLKFTIDANELFGDFWKFIVATVDHSVMELSEIKVDSISYEISIDRYGNLKKLSGSALVSVSLKKMDFPYGLLPDLKANVSYIETYENVGKTQDFSIFK